MKQIIFTNVGGVDEKFSPQPASKFIPDWYKNLDSYIGQEKKPNGDGNTTATIKRCIPVFDAITAGYIIVSPADIFVSQQDGKPYYEWSNHGLISFHGIEQAPEHPGRNGLPSYPKLNNPWAIKTPIGYSVLFTQPVHRESPFKILDGVVDTDRYFAPVNFPFVLVDPTFEGMVPAGTPIAQVIPFKRDSWQMSTGGVEVLEEQSKITRLLRTKFFDSYKTQFWNKKEYR